MLLDSDNAKERLDVSLIGVLGIIRGKVAVKMETLYNTLKQKNSDKSDRHSSNRNNLDRLLIKDDNGKIKLAEKNKIHIKEAISFTGFENIVKLMEKSKIRWEGNFSNKEFFLHKADFIKHCVSTPKV